MNVLNFLEKLKNNMRSNGILEMVYPLFVTVKRVDYETALREREPGLRPTVLPFIVQNGAHRFTAVRELMDEGLDCNGYTCKIWIEEELHPDELMALRVNPESVGALADDLLTQMERVLAMDVRKAEDVTKEVLKDSFITVHDTHFRMIMRLSFTYPDLWNLLRKKVLLFTLLTF